MDTHGKDAHLIESCITSENVWKGRLLDVRRDVVRLPDGSEGVREYVTHPGAVVIIPVLPNGKLIFERQYRYPVGRVMLELPAG
ncbi:MAG: NUDIX hydrolase, partial [Fluviibacter sp.]